MIDQRFVDETEWDLERAYLEYFRLLVKLERERLVREGKGISIVQVIETARKKVKRFVENIDLK